MEAAHSLFHGDAQLILHHSLRAVLRELEVVDTGHDTREVVIGAKRCFVGFADDRQRRVEALEA